MFFFAAKPQIFFAPSFLPLCGKSFRFRLFRFFPCGEAAKIAPIFFPALRAIFFRENRKKPTKHLLKQIIFSIFISDNQLFIIYVSIKMQALRSETDRFLLVSIRQRQRPIYSPLWKMARKCGIFGEGQSENYC